jgi:hypothetical protein
MRCLFSKVIFLGDASPFPPESIEVCPSWFSIAHARVATIHPKSNSSGPHIRLAKENVLNKGLSTSLLPGE